MCSVYRCVSLILLGFPHLPCFGCSTSFPMISLSAMRSPDSFKKTKGCLWSPWSSRLPSYETNFMNCCNSHVDFTFFPNLFSPRKPIVVCGLIFHSGYLRVEMLGLIDEAKRIYSNLQFPRNIRTVSEVKGIIRFLTRSLIVKIKKIWPKFLQML